MTLDKPQRLVDRNSLPHRFEALSKVRNFLNSFSSRRFLRGTAKRAAITYAVANVANAIVPFALIPVLTRALTPYDYGLVAMFGILLNILNAVIGLNGGSAISVRYFQFPATRMPRYIGSCVTIVVISSVILTATVLFIGRPLALFLQLPLLCIILALIAAMAQVVSALRLNLWQAQGSATFYGAFQVGQGVLNASLTLVLVLILHLSWLGRVAAQAASAVVFMMIAIGALVRDRDLKFAANRDDIWDALKFGVPLIPHLGGGLLIAAADRLLVARLLGLADAGVYVVASQLGFAMGLLTDAINRAYAPWLYAELAKTELSRDIAIVRGTYIYFGILISVSIAIGALGGGLLPLMAGPAFSGAASLIIYVALGYALGGMYYTVTGYVFFASKTAKLALITLSAGLFNVVVTYFLIKRNGLMGAAQGFVLSQAALFVGTWILAQRSRPMPWRKALRFG